MQMTKYNERWRRNVCDQPVPTAVQRSLVSLGQNLPFRVSCMVHQAFHADVRHIVAANVVADIPEAEADHGSEPYRETRTASTEGR